MSHQFARRVFLWSAIYGIAVLLPQYFMEGQVGRDFPPPITHPEHFYGFIGVALAWQFVFIIISRDVVRYRLMMLPAAFEKFSFGVATLVLFANGRVAAFAMAFAVLDLVLGTLFLVCFARGPRGSEPAVATAGGPVDGAGRDGGRPGA